MRHGLTIEQMLAECERRHLQECEATGKSPDYYESQHSRVARYLRAELGAMDCEMMAAAEKAVASMEAAAALTDSDVMAQDLYDASDRLRNAIEGEADMGAFAVHVGQEAEQDG